MSATADWFPCFLESSYGYYGANIPGKPVAQLLNPTGRRTLQRMIAEVTESDYSMFIFTSSAN